MHDIGCNASLDQMRNAIIAIKVIENELKKQLFKTPVSITVLSTLVDRLTYQRRRIQCTLDKCPGKI